MASTTAQPQASRTDSQETFQTEATPPVEDHPENLISHPDDDLESWKTYSTTSSLEKVSTYPSLSSQLPPLAPVQSENLRKCWICYEDSSEEDTTIPPRWRTPCPCSLVAHETCLLEWIADKELTRGSLGESNKKLQCPQCESEIKVFRPTSYFFTWMRRGDRLVSQIALPASASLLVASVLLGCYHHGLWSVRLLFGKEDAALILRDLQRHHGWRLTYGFIPAALFLSRTDADFAVPIFELYVIFRHFPQYLTMARLPPVANKLVYFSLLRHVYNYSHSWLSQRLRQRWMANIRQPNEPGLENEEEQELPDEGFQLGINIEIDMEEGADAPPNEEQADDRNLGEFPQVHGLNDGMNVAQAAAPAEADPPQRNGNQIIIGTASILRTLIGALAFPAIASGMGALLRLSLPASMIQSKPYFLFFGSRSSLDKGLLQSQWGRSLIGGCLFVVAKDATILFTQWRLAKNFRKRRVMDWVGTRGREADGSYVLRD